MRLLLLLLLTKAPATFEDLKTLAAQQSYPELLERAEDVAPAARNDAWRELVATAATRVVQSTKIADDPFGQAARADALIERFSFLDKQPAFLAARDEAIVSGLRRCASANDEACFKLFGRYEKTLSPAGSLAAGKVLRRNGSFAYRPMVLFARAVGGKDAAACKDPDVADAVLAALDLPAESEGAKAGRQVGYEWCWAALQPKLKAAMIGASSMRLANACKPMREKKALTELQDELCKDVDL
ncbi:MAG: hypothetical protein H6Q89_5537 [Myxococcaceae bacterium]|nr:hypothetical protein [Myxococcaceae bacterium]